LALQYAEKIDTWILESISTLVKMAWAKFLLGEIETADTLMNRAKEVFAKDSSGKVRSYASSSEGALCAEILTRTGRYEDALAISNYNLAFLKREGWKDDVGCYRVIGMIYEAKEDYTKAKSYYDKSVKLIFDTGMREETILAMLCRGRLLIELKDFKGANNDLQFALAMAESCKYLWEVDIRNALVKLAMARGESVKLYNQLFRDLSIVKSRAVETGYKWAESDS
jgi:tetratricopeptide (TPR) repeat protein